MITGKLKNLKIWYLRHRIKYLKEACEYLRCGIAVDQHLLEQHQREIRKLNMKLATEMPASMMLEELNASKWI